MAQRYARGTEAWGLCKRCGLQFKLRNLIFDGYMPGLRVCVDCYDGRHPQEYPVNVTDPISVWRSTPDDPPYASVLSGTVNQGTVSLTWTPANDSGAARYESTTLLRAVSVDGVNFGPFLALGVFPITYDDFGGVLTQTLAYQDTVSIVGYYQYMVTAQDLNGKGPASAGLILDVTQLIPLRLLEDGVSFRVLEDGVTFRELEQ